MSCAGIFFARTGHTHGPLGYSIAGVRILRFCQVENVKASKFHVSLFLCCMHCQDQLFGLIAAAIRYVDLDLRRARFGSDTCSYFQKGGEQVSSSREMGLMFNHSLVE